METTGAGGGGARHGEALQEIELPLAPVLARMERTGVRIDTGELRRLAELMEARSRG